MKTQIPKSVGSVEEAKAFLSELVKNEEDYHPEDDAFEILWSFSPEPNDSEKKQLNKLMRAIAELDGFDPCEFILDLHTASK